MYKLHYLDKIRPLSRGGALVFGAALDVALNELLVPTGKSPEAVFDEAFTHTEIGGKQTFVPTCTELVYSNADFDLEILIPNDFENLYRKIEEGSLKTDTIESDIDLESLYNTLSGLKKEIGLDNFNQDQLAIYNFINWMSLRRKGHLMIAAYRKDVLPNLSKIHEVQREINLTNEDGDAITGIVDLVADVRNLGTFILDNKSSSAPYKEDSVTESAQLGLYVHCLEEEYKTRQAGYIVLNKKVKKNRLKVCTVCGHDAGGAKTCNNVIQKKRCHGDLHETMTPEIKVQIILGEIPLQMQENVIEQFDAINEKIKAQEFEPNEKTCYNYFGKKCPYFNLCHGGDSEGLIDMKKEKK